MSVVVPFDNSELMSLSAATLSSYPLGVPESTYTSRSAGFNTALYDPSSDSVHILPHSRQRSADSQNQDSTIAVGNAKSSNRSKFVYSPSACRSSFDLPLRHQGSGHIESNTTTAVSSFKFGHIRGKTVDLMSPPPGRKRSHKALIDHTSSKSVDANPSAALTQQIASSVRQERHGNATANAPSAAASGTGQAEPPPRWGLPSNPKSWINHSRSSSRSSGPGSRLRTRIPSIPEANAMRPPNTEEEDDPFQYDSQNVIDERRSRSREPGHMQSQSRSHTKSRSRDINQGFPCPFRRRNPVVFNVRDHESCARRPFADISELRRHLRAEHRVQKAQFRCPRCQQPFAMQNEMTDHLMVPLEEMCEARPAQPDDIAELGITEAVERALTGNQVHTWDELWYLLFPQDNAVLDPEILPVVEIFEAEEGFEDSSHELKEDLCECLRRVLPDQPGDSLVYNVLAGQIQLVFEQHRAKVSRRCRNSVSGKSRPAPSMDKSRVRLSRFSVSASSYGSSRPPFHQRSSSSYSSSYSHRPTATNTNTTRPRKTYGQGPPSLSRTNTTSPTSSSIYSRDSSMSRRARSMTRSSSLSIESPRLPFREWVQGVKLSPESLASTSPGQRDSGLAMQCDDCGVEPCQCGTYADHLSAFLTPMPGTKTGTGMMNPAGLMTAVPPSSATLSPYGNGHSESDDGDVDWAADYVDQVLSAGGLLTAPAAVMGAKIDTLVGVGGGGAAANKNNSHKTVVKKKSGLGTHHVNLPACRTPVSAIPPGPQPAFI
ncbi:hypothetical protein BD289DRAFT_438915 [Coniella lustricola]|uniref:C2H2-type domain-containing protein n=1 Tax=Coniella lustricola TaxID=2025994 RepID=A0A2T3A295_9PEZI|nr:hypothetical protein BD289DRAFT_438915 [Coniella lustricola]